MIFKTHTDTATSMWLICTTYFAKVSRDRVPLLKKWFPKKKINLPLYLQQTGLPFHSMKEHLDHFSKLKLNAAPVILTFGCL